MKLYFQLNDASVNKSYINPTENQINKNGYGVQRFEGTKFLCNISIRRKSLFKIVLIFIYLYIKISPCLYLNINICNTKELNSIVRVNFFKVPIIPSLYVSFFRKLQRKRSVKCST